MATDVCLEKDSPLCAQTLYKAFMYAELKFESETGLRPRDSFGGGQASPQVRSSSFINV